MTDGARVRGEAQAGHLPAQQLPVQHLPVMFEQVMEGLQVQENGTYLDGTFGRGGHARGVLQRLGPGGRLLLMDKDPEAIAHAEQSFGGDARVATHRGSFAALAQWQATSAGLDGILLDLGVSSPQLDVAERGFSFGKDGPLDMRMDPDSGESAAQWIARADEAEIADVLWTYGEERLSRRIAKAIVARRSEKSFTRTADLADLLGAVVGRGKHASGKKELNPATRSFQAIRIHINRELADLETGLDAALERLKVGGRLAVISFHSLEDRIVKRFIAKYAKAPPANRRLPELEIFVPTLKSIGDAMRADSSETSANPRSRSAVLRVAGKLGGDGRETGGVKSQGQSPRRNVPGNPDGDSIHSAAHLPPFPPPASRLPAPTRRQP